MSYLKHQLVPFSRQGSCGSALLLRHKLGAKWWGAACQIAKPSPGGRLVARAPGHGVQWQLDLKEHKLLPSETPPPPPSPGGFLSHAGT